MADDERLVREVEAHRRALAFDVNLCHACGKSWPCLARRLSDRLAASEQEAARLGATTAPEAERAGPPREGAE
jgi:hypothetical protein